MIVVALKVSFLFNGGWCVGTFYSWGCYYQYMLLEEER